MIEPESKPDWEDRLVDLALEESLGGQAPPDLSEKILAASSSASVASVELGEQAMNDIQHVQISRRKHWAMFAAAASLLVAVGMLAFMDQFGGVRRARMAATTEREQKAEAPESSLERSKISGPSGEVVDRFGSPMEPPYELTRESLDEGGPATDTVADLDAVLPVDELQNEDKLLIMVTPKILTDGEQPTELGVSAGTDAPERLELGQPQASNQRATIGKDENGVLGISPAQKDAKVNSLGHAYRTNSFGKPASELVGEFAAPAGGVGGRGATSSGRAAGQSSSSAKNPSPDALVQAPQSVELQESVTGDVAKVERAKSQASTNSGAAPVSAPGGVNAQISRKITEYQQLARRSRGRDSQQLSGRILVLSSEIDDLRRVKRRYDAQQGSGPGTSGDQYARIYENPFVQTKTTEENFSTFSIDVDTASYANVRQFLMQSGQLPPPDAVRLEELVNYFDYDYSGPTGDVPFDSHVEVAGCPWNAEHRLVRIGIKGKEIDRDKRPQSNLVFLIDVSGSMNEPTKLPLLVEGMKLLTRELSENDKVAIVVYASSEGLALPSTRGDKQQQILTALDKLRAGGSTAGGAGIELAYNTAVENYIEGGVNRVILCTDGDFNVGVTSTGDLERMAESNAKETGVFLTVLGFGRGNLNDAMMERISGKGNGNYHYVDNLTEARKVLVEEMAGTLVTIAKDVKIQIDFNPYQVAGYRLLGYENRMLRTEDFNNDKKDAGEIGAGHTVTALYEIVPAGKSVDVPPVDASKYVKPTEEPSAEEVSQELLTLRIRYKQPDADTSTKQEFPITDEGGSFAEATPDFQFASAVASFGMLLRDSEHKGNTSYAAVKEIAEGASQRDEHGYRAEFLQLIDRARQLSRE